MVELIPRYERELHVSSMVNLAGGYLEFRHLSKDSTYFFGSGAEAISFYLASLELNADAVVGVPLYSCSSVYQAVNSAHLKIRFIDVVFDESGYSIPYDQLCGLDAFIFIHYYGYYYDGLRLVKETFPNLTILEDCSHIAMKDYPPQTDTDAAFFSFNFHKPVSCGMGGGLLLNKSTPRQKISELYLGLPKNSFLSDFKKTIISFVKDLAFHPNVYRHLLPIIEKKRSRQRDAAPFFDFYPRRMSFYSKCLLGNQRRKKGMTGITNIGYMRFISELRLAVPTEALDKLIYFPLFFADSVQRDSVRCRLSALGIDCFILWENVFNNAEFYNSDFDHCIKVKVMLDRILFLPKSLFYNERHLKQLDSAVEVVTTLVKDAA